MDGEWWECFPVVVGGIYLWFVPCYRVRSAGGSAARVVPLSVCVTTGVYIRGMFPTATSKSPLWYIKGSTSLTPLTPSAHSCPILLGTLQFPPASLQVLHNWFLQSTSIIPTPRNQTLQLQSSSSLTMPIYTIERPTPSAAAPATGKYTMYTLSSHVLTL